MITNTYFKFDDLEEILGKIIKGEEAKNIKKAQNIKKPNT